MRESVSIGATRLTGNMLSDSPAYTFSNDYLSVSVRKVSKFIFANSSSEEVLIRSSWDNQLVAISIPFNALFDRYETLVHVESVWRPTSNSLLSNEVEVDLYSSRYPISFDGFVQVEKIDV
jgi:hypothetical protein